MKLYKYRSLEYIEHSLDILLNERLHCAPYENLNDPFEGLFLHVLKTGGVNSLGLGTGINTFGLGTRTIKSPRSVSDLPIPGGTRICSLSASLNDVRLWSHYANGHTGIAVEINLNESEHELHEVEYTEKLKEFTSSLLTGPETTNILKLKSNHWEYEKEYRIISKNEFFSISGMVSGIYIGLRTPELLTKMLLRVIPNTIPIFSTRLSDDAVEIELNKALNLDATKNAAPVS